MEDNTGTRRCFKHREYIIFHLKLLKTNPKLTESGVLVPDSASKCLLECN